MKKMTKISLVIVISIIVFLLAIFYIKTFVNNFKSSSIVIGQKVSNKLIYDKTFDENFNEITINAKASNIYIKESDTIKVMIYGKKNKTKVDANDKLTIKVDEIPCVGVCINNTISKVEVYLPTLYQSIININNSSGEIKIEKFPNLIMKINEDYGDVFIKEGYDISIKNNYGNIKINQINNYLDIDESYGDIEIDNVNINENSHIKNNYGDINIGFTNKIYIDASTNLGSTKINNNYQKSDITLKLKNDYGDIIVKN